MHEAKAANIIPATRIELSWSLFCVVVLGALSSYAIVWLRKRELVALPEMFYGCRCSVSLPHNSLGCLQSMIVSILTYRLVSTYYITRASKQENLSSGVCEQQRRRQACASAQSGQRRCYSPIAKDHI